MPSDTTARRTDGKTARGSAGATRGEKAKTQAAAGTRFRGGVCGPRRWARTVSAVAPAGVVSILGLRLGAYGRRLAAETPDRLAGLPVEADARFLSATAELVSDLSAALGVLVGVATGWLVLAAAVRVAARAG